MDSGFGDDVGVKAVAKVDRVDVIAGEKKKKRGRNVSLCFVICVDPKQLLGIYDWKDSPFEITVHNREEHLEEEVDGVDQHRQKVKPCFARHHCEIDVASSIIGNISIAKQRI